MMHTTERKIYFDRMFSAFFMPRDILLGWFLASSRPYLEMKNNGYINQLYYSA